MPRLSVRALPHTRRTLLRAGGAAAAVLWVSACGRANGTIPSAQPVSLVLWEAHSPQMTAATQNQIARLHQKVSQFRVEQTKVVFGDNYDKVIAAVAAGTAPDIAPIWSGLLPQFAAQGTIVSLDQYGARAVAKELYPAVLPSVEYKDKLWGLPYSMSPLFYVYNKSLAAAGGVAGPPKTWDDLVEVGRKLTTPQVGGFSIPTTAEGLSQHFQMLLWQSGGELFDKGVTRATFQNPAGEAALQLLVDLARKHRTLPPPGASTGRTGFLQGTVASFIDGPWIFDERNRVAPEIQYDVAEPPLPRGRPPATFASTGGYVVFSPSKHPKDAAEFIKYVSSREGQAILIQSFKGAARGDIFDEPEVKALTRDTPQLLIMRVVGKYARIDPNLPEWGRIRKEALLPPFEAAMTGDIGVKEALTGAAHTAEAILATRR